MGDSPNNIQTDTLHAGNVRTLGTRRQVLTAIEERILRDRLRAGDPLPPERDLAQALGVGVARVQDALRVLESVGVVDTAPTGTARTMSARPVPALGSLLRLCMALSRFHTSDLMSTRIELERCAAAGAAATATEDDIARLRTVVAEMGRPDVTSAQFGKLDCEFHLGIARAGRNNLAADLLDAMRDAIRAAMTMAHADELDWSATRRRLAREHNGILAAIENHDEDAAMLRVAAHIGGFYDLPSPQRANP